MKLTEKQKRKVLKIINDRSIEILDALKEELQTHSTSDTMDQTFEVLSEFEALKQRVWRYP